MAHLQQCENRDLEYIFKGKANKYSEEQKEERVTITINKFIIC